MKQFKVNVQSFWFTGAFTFLTLLVGILFATNPWILEKICIIIGSILLLAGAVLLVVYFVKKRAVPQPLMYGLFSMAGGILLCIVPTVLKILIPIFFGIWILLSSLSGIYRNFSFRRELPRWWIGFLLCIVCAGLGVYVLSRPVTVMESTIRLIGICMIIHAVFRLISIFMGRKCYHQDSVVETTIKE
jgi:uncharacterized membrane protein HdeD (DUF308 family)